MSDHAEASATAPGEPSLARELEAIPYEPLLPIEKKLIVSCLVLGVVLLGLLLWASATFFPVSDPAVSWDLFQSPDVLREAQAEHRRRLAGQSYQSLLGPDQKPPLDYRNSPGQREQ